MPKHSIARNRPTQFAYGDVPGRWPNGPRDCHGLLPGERRHSFPELSLAYARRGSLKSAWKLARLSCQKAEALKARYEHAKSLLVQGQIAQRLGQPESADQILQATTEIKRVEEAADTALVSRTV